MKAKNISESGILVAFTLAILYASSILPVSKLSVLTLASAIIPIAIIRTSVKSTFLIYLASSLLSFFILPINISLYYILFFGIYGLIKYYIEKLKKLFFEIILKLACFNVSLYILYFITNSFLDVYLLNNYLYIFWFVAQFVFLIYDYALTIIISFYLQRLHKNNY